MEARTYFKTKTALLVAVLIAEMTISVHIIGLRGLALSIRSNMPSYMVATTTVRN